MSYAQGLCRFVNFFACLACFNSCMIRETVFALRFFWDCAPHLCNTNDPRRGKKETERNHKKNKKTHRIMIQKRDIDIWEEMSKITYAQIEKNTQCWLHSNIQVRRYPNSRIFCGVYLLNTWCKNRRRCDVVRDALNPPNSKASDVHEGWAFAGRSRQWLNQNYRRLVVQTDDDWWTYDSI